MDLIKEFEKCLFDNDFTVLRVANYVETLKQHYDEIDGLKQLCDLYNIELTYTKPQEYDYTNGIVCVRFYPEGGTSWHDIKPFRYEMTLRWEERHWGYCECKPDDEGYNALHSCCGNGCDWDAPAIHVSYISDLGSYSFDGIERDMWALEEKYENLKNGVKNDKIQAEIDYIDGRINELVKQKELLVKEMVN